MRARWDGFIASIIEGVLGASESKSRVMQCLAAIPWLLGHAAIAIAGLIAVAILLPLIFIVALLTAPMQRHEAWIDRRKGGSM